MNGASRSKVCTGSAVFAHVMFTDGISSSRSAHAVSGAGKLLSDALDVSLDPLDTCWQNMAVPVVAFPLRSLVQGRS